MKLQREIAECESEKEGKSISESSTFVKRRKGAEGSTHAVVSLSRSHFVPSIQPVRVCCRNGKVL